jgi:DNA-directed RNA polymerase alpha subunit
MDGEYQKYREIWAEQDRRARSFPLYDGLSIRARNCLSRNDFVTKEQILRAYEDGSIKTVRNLGKKIYNEILVWLGETPRKVCPYCHQQIEIKPGA